MPDDKPSESIQEETIQHVANRECEAINPAPHIPLSAQTQGVSGSNMEGAIQAERDSIKRAERWMIRLTAAIVLLTLGLVIVGTLQWNAMRGQLDEMKSGGIDTHNLAEATISASRAWVVVQGTGFGFTKDKHFPQGRVVLADSGNSPAFGVDGWRCVEIRGDEPPLRDGQLQKSPTAVCLSVAGGTLGRGVPITMDAFVTAQAPANFSKDTEGAGSHFYYWGTITYGIYPSDGKRHSTSFCLKNGGDQLSACREGGYEAN